MYIHRWIDISYKVWPCLKLRLCNEGEDKKSSDTKGLFFCEYAEIAFIYFFLSWVFQLWFGLMLTKGLMFCIWKKKPQSWGKTERGGSCSIPAWWYHENGLTWWGVKGISGSSHNITLWKKIVQSFIKLSQLSRFYDISVKCVLFFFNLLKPWTPYLGKHRDKSDDRSISKTSVVVI